MRLVSRIGITMLGLCLTFGLPVQATQAANPDWSITTVDTAGDVGAYTSAALQATGMPAGICTIE